MHCHFGRLYFVHRSKSPFKNPIFGTGLELLTNQVPIVVYCHSYKELKMANFALCTVHAKMPCKCEFHTSPCKCEFRTSSCKCEFRTSPCKCEFCTSPCKCEFRTIHATLVRNLLCFADSTWDIFLCIFDVNSFLIPVISQSQALLCKDYKRGGNHLSNRCYVLHLVKYRVSLLSLSLYYFLFLGIQTTSEDVFPEDERLNLWFLGVKEVRWKVQMQKWKTLVH